MRKGDVLSWSSAPIEGRQCSLMHSNIHSTAHHGTLRALIVIHSYTCELMTSNASADMMWYRIARYILSAVAVDLMSDINILVVS